MPCIARTGSSGDYTVDVLLGGKWYDLECFSSELHDEDLTHKNTHNNKDKEIVIKEICKDIQFIFFKFSAIEEVKYL